MSVIDKHPVQNERIRHRSHRKLSLMVNSSARIFGESPSFSVVEGADRISQGRSLLSWPICEPSLSIVAATHGSSSDTCSWHNIRGPRRYPIAVITSNLEQQQMYHWSATPRQAPRGR